ncbi:MAG TPA: hypothetical protein PKB02_18795 [Anaerohalosphaeraceae bacterium]|nr:hypothetical protein [Anaerohalosphaeraceae bacterium]
MALERDIQQITSKWRFMIIGFVCGVLVCVLTAVVIACMWGPQGESIEVDMYSGSLIIHKHYLWKRSRVPGPMQPYSQWAIDHQDPVKSWFIPASSTGRSEWFGQMLSVDLTTRSHVFELYSLAMSEEEKVRLLMQYHQDLDALKMKLQEQKEIAAMEAFYIKWDQKIDALKLKP